ncbi:MAG TPA: YncE family protein [Streptosporangiaceae bacterium]
MTLTRTGYIAIPPGREPGFDHADIYRDAGRATRLYVAHTGADRVDVLDTAAGSWLRALPDHPGVAGILVDQEAALLFTSDRAAARVSAYRCPDETLLARVAVGPHPNGLAFDSGRRRLFSFNLGEPPGRNCTASVVDLDRQQVVATIALPGRPRWAGYDAATDQVHACIREPAQIVAIGAGTLTIDRVTPVPASGPHGLWVDGGRLYCAADGNALVVLHRDTGTLVRSLPLPGSPDVIMHDPALGHLYVAIGDPGVITVADTRSLAIIETVPTEPGAHTLGLDPDRHAVYALLPVTGGAAIYQDR